MKLGFVVNCGLVRLPHSPRGQFRWGELRFCSDLWSSYTKARLSYFLTLQLQLRNKDSLRVHCLFVSIHVSKLSAYSILPLLVNHQLFTQLLSPTSLSSPSLLFTSPASSLTFQHAISPPQWSPTLSPFLYYPSQTLSSLLSNPFFLTSPPHHLSLHLVLYLPNSADILPSLSLSHFLKVAPRSRALSHHPIQSDPLSFLTVEMVGGNRNSLLCV